MNDRPLAAASLRLRGKPGRPGKAGLGGGAQAWEASVLSRRASGYLEEQSVTRRPLDAVPVNVPAPRLLDVAGAARYLAVSPWTVRELEAAGILRRVRVPLPNGGELRKVLFDRADLDRLVDGWKEAP